MKVQAIFVIVVSLLVTAQANHLFAAYAGTTIGGPSFNPPNFASGGACTAATYAAAYQVFNMTVTTANMFNIQVLFEQDFKTNNLVVLYSTFTSAMPCANVVGNKALSDQLGSSGGPTINDFVYLSPGMYFGIVTGESASAAGLFAANVFAANYTGTTLGATKLWNYPQASSQGATCTSGSELTPFASITHSPASSGLYDIGVYFYNATYDSLSLSTWYTSAVVFSGTPNVTNPCDTALDLSRVSAYSNSKYGVFIRNVTLNAGTTYTIALSGQGVDQVGFYGVNVFPTIVHTTEGSPLNYNPPDRSTAPPCTPLSTPTPYWVFTFIAQYPTYIFDTQEAFSGYDTFSFLYSGLNNASTGPATCTNFLYGGDTGDIRPVAYIGLVPGQPYTVIVTPYSQSSTGTGNFAFYAMTGTQLGVVPTTGMPTTSGGSATTSPVTNGQQTTTGGQATNGGTSAAPTATGATTAVVIPSSPAIVVYASVSMILLCILIALF